MNFTLPIYVEERRTSGAPAPVYLVRPLFRSEPERRAERLPRALTLLAGDMRQALGGLAGGADHRALADWTFAPETEESLLEVRIEGKFGSAAVSFLFVVCHVLGRRVAFTPSLLDLWFEVPKGQDLRGVATAVLTRFFRDQQREGGLGLTPTEVALSGKAWTTRLEVAVNIPALPREQKSDPWALLTDEAVLSGEEELERVGRCLDRLYPDDLDRAVGREREIEELARLLHLPDRRPVLLVGPRQAGKTAIVHEHVYRQAAQRTGRPAASSQLWLLAPQRLVSGMAYVGQWEKRLLAIVEEAAKRGHVLYFDDLLGLCLAGVTCSSDLSMAQVLKPHLDRRRVRVLAEMTPEAFRVLKEMDRGFADLFHVLPVAETSEIETLRILIAARQQLETRHGCRFGLDALPLAMDLQRRYAADLAQPGKVAGFLRQLAAKFRDASIGRGEVLAEFAVRSGLPRSFLDPELTIERGEVVEGLARHVIGQREAVESAADVIVTACARLNDPQRPLGSLLFLGPTGVGKTECAKAVARFLFGDSERLVRFDLNEFVSPAAAARLIGTPEQPEGLLTAAVRRQPFCVLLFDEIEKAHPDVLDLLLALLGEGRLTDALGRTAHFTNALVIMTSNLGARESRHRLGFTDGAKDDREVYVSAARHFFRPEFFNRIDRLVAFQPLDRSGLERIAGRLIDDLFVREGMRRPNRFVHLHRSAFDRLVTEGYHPQLGARALKRAFDRLLVRPLGARFASLAPGAACLATIHPRGNGLAVEVTPLKRAEPRGGIVSSLDVSDRTAILERVAAALSRLRSQLPAPGGQVDSGGVSVERHGSLDLHELWERLWLILQLQEPRGPAAPPGLRSMPPRHGRGRKSKSRRSGSDGSPDRRTGQAIAQFDDAMDDLLAEASGLAAWQWERQFPHDAEEENDPFFRRIRPQSAERGLALLVGGTALLSAAVANWGRRDEWLIVRSALLSGAWSEPLSSVQTAELFREQVNIQAWASWWTEAGTTGLAALEGTETGRVSVAVLWGPTASLLAGIMSGTWLRPGDGGRRLTQVFAFPVPEGTAASTVLADLGARQRRWLEALARDEATLADAPFPLQPMIADSNEDLWDYGLSQLPLPPEFRT
ncbi:MAG TPA: AAA family ATPase [Verrucomicrobiota bacterium]|nr:AAA family ATPase [Verrucomicrobiota bacterium]